MKAITQHWIGWLILAVLVPGLVHAEPSINVSVDRKEIQPGERVELSVQVATEADMAGQANLEAPDLDGWNLVGRYERTSIDGYRNQKLTTLTLVLQPDRTGDIEIGVFELKTRKKTFRSKSIKISVKNGSGKGADPSARERTTHPDVPDETAYLAWEVDDDDVWLGEAIQARLVLYYRDGLNITRFNSGEVNLTGFWNDEHKQDDRRNRARRVQKGNLIFISKEVSSYTLYPLKAGEQTLPRINVEMTLSRGGFFNSGRSAQIDRVASPVPIQVKALPTESRPKRFSGLTVGAATLRSRLDRRRIKADEGVQLEVETRIEGLMQNVPEITLPDLPAFQVFPSTTDIKKVHRGERYISIRKQTWLLRPKKSGRLEIPAFSFPFFDPESGTYQTAKTRKLVLSVRGKPKVSPEAKKAEPRRDLIALQTIRTEINGGAVTADSNVGTILTVIFFGAPLLFFIGIMTERLRLNREADTGKRQAKGAARRAEKQLDAIIQSPDGGVEGYSAISQALIEFLERRLSQAFRGLTQERIAERLRERGVEESIIGDLRSELDASDFARFARVTDTGDLKLAVERARGVILRLEETL